MKNINKHIITLSLLFATALLFNACEEDSSDFEYNGEALVSFAVETQGIYYVTDAEGNADTIKAYINKPASKDLTFSVIVDESSTAVEGTDFNLESNTITIKKGEVEGIIVVKGIYSALPDCATKVVNLKLTSDAAEYDNIYSLSLNKFFPFVITDFEGSFTVNDDTDDPYNVSVTIGEGNNLTANGIWGMDADITLEMDPDNFSVNIAEQLLFEHSTYGNVYIKSNSAGSFKSCDNSLDLNFKVYADAGTFQNVTSSVWTKNSKSEVITFNKDIKTLKIQ
ncbi:MAG: hypothetical protein U9R32_00470 [Bacteroidota bacterium]|nr:hypothetical protein [Bacteroidota bacterium]